MSAYFADPRLKTAFTFQDVYMGMSPFEAPATFSLMPYTELARGVWYPKGGMYRVVETLTDLARQAGVEFILNSAVDRIDTNSTHARGVLLSERTITARISRALSATWDCQPTPVFISTPRHGSTHPCPRKDRIP